MVETFQQYKERLIKSGKRVIVTTKPKGADKPTSTEKFKGGKLVSSSSSKQDMSEVLITPVTIQNKVYRNVTRGEAERNRLAENTKAVLLPSQTAARRQFITARQNIEQGKGTSADLLIIASGGKGETDIIKTAPRALAAERLRKKALVAKQETFQKEKKRVQTTKNIKKLSGVSNVIASKLENWGFSINKRESESKRRQADRDARVFSNNLERESATKGIPSFYLRSNVQSINKILGIGEKLFTGTLNFGEQLALAGEKAIFLLPALGRNIATGSALEFLQETSPLTGDRADLLKEIYTNPRTYRDALIGAAVATILGGVKSRKLTAKEVKQIPARTTKFKRGTILRDASNNVAYVSKGGITKNIPKGFRVITRSLTRKVTEFNFKNVKTFPKVSKFKVNTILKDAKGNLRIVSKNGKVQILTKSQAKKVLKAEKEGTLFRKSRTKEARKILEAERKVLKKPSKRAAKILRKNILKKEIAVTNKEIALFSKKFKLTSSEKSVFQKAYRSFKKKPTDSNVKALKRLSDKIEVRTIVKSLDDKILQSINKAKISSIKKARLQDIYQKRISSLKKARAIKKKPQKVAKRKNLQEKEKLKKFVKKTIQKKKTDIRRAKLQAEAAARKQGFKTVDEQFRYSEAFRKFQRTRLPKYEKILMKIENMLSKRVGSAAKTRLKLIRNQRKLVLNQALKKLRSGEIRIKSKINRIRQSRTKLTPNQKIKINRFSKTQSKSIKNIEDVTERAVVGEETATILEKVEILKPKVKVRGVTKTSKPLSVSRSTTSSKVLRPVLVEQKNVMIETRNVKNIDTKLRFPSKSKISQSSIPDLGIISFSLVRQSQLIDNSIKNGTKAAQKLEEAIEKVNREGSKQSPIGDILRENKNKILLASISAQKLKQILRTVLIPKKKKTEELLRLIQKIKQKIKQKRPKSFKKAKTIKGKKKKKKRKFTPTIAGLDKKGKSRRKKSFIGTETRSK